MIKLRSFALLIILPLFIFMLHACMSAVSGEGELTMETRNLSAFSKVEVDLDANIILTDSLQQSCMVSAQENLMPIIGTKIKGERLIIYAEKNIRNNKPITIYLSVNRLTHIELNGSGEITSTNMLKSGNLDLEISGSGKQKLSVVCDRLHAEISGSGSLELNGSSNESTLEISGSGIIDAFQLATGNCRVEISGSGQSYVFPSGELKAEVSGSGKVLYKGAPVNIIPSISGSGSIEKSE